MGKDISFLSFIPLFFSDIDYFTWGHLWFLIYLFVFTLLYMPLFAAINRHPGRGGGLRAGWLYSPLLPLIMMQVALRQFWPGHQNLYDDWGNFCYYSAFLIMGFILGRTPAIEAAIQREWKRAGTIGLALAVVFLAGWRQGDRIPGLTEYGKDVVEYLHYYILGTATGWCLLIGLLGFARTHLQIKNKALTYLAASALPIYILHQEAITYPGWFIINLPWNSAAKIALLLPLSVALSLITYHCVVRRFNVLRALFGMKLVKKEKRREAEAA